MFWLKTGPAMAGLDATAMAGLDATALNFNYVHDCCP